MLIVILAFLKNILFIWQKVLLKPNALNKNFYKILSYTFKKSIFKNKAYWFDSFV